MMKASQQKSNRITNRIEYHNHKWQDIIKMSWDTKWLKLTLKPSSGFSLVMRAAMTWPHGRGLLGGLSKSMGWFSHWLTRYSVRIDLMRYNGIPIATCSCAAGRLMSDTISVHGCSTCYIKIVTSVFHWWFSYFINKNCWYSPYSFKYL